MFNPNQAFLLVQKLKSTPRAFTLGVKAELEKIFSICPKLRINAELRAKQQAKNAQSWPQVFSALTPSVKGALDGILFSDLGPIQGHKVQHLLVSSGRLKIFFLFQP